MKVKPDQLASQLSKQLAPIYIVSGDDPLLVMECCDQIRKAARKAGYSEQHLLQADLSGFDWSELLEHANSMSLFAERKLLELRLPNGKPGERGNKVLQHYASNPSTDNLLLFITGKLDKSTQNSKWFKALEKAGVFIQIWPLELRQLPGWINNRLQKADLKADSDAISILVDRVEGNLLAAAQEIEKLKLLAPDGRVDAELLLESVADSARYDVFGLLDSALAGDLRHTMKMLSGLKAEGAEPISLLWALTREIRQLSQLAALRHHGRPLDSALEEVSKQSRIPVFLLKKRKGLIQASLKRHSERQLRNMLSHAATIDRAIKGVEDATVWDELTTLTLNLAGFNPGFH